MGFALRDDQLAGYSRDFLARVEQKRIAAEKVAAAAAFQRAEELRKRRLAEFAEEVRRTRAEALARKVAEKAELISQREQIATAALARSKAERQELEAQVYKRRVRVADIERRACRVFKVTLAALRGRRRSRYIVFARQFVMYWAARQTELSLPQIGRLMGRDHTTILHGKKTYVEKRAHMGRFLRPVR